MDAFTRLLKPTGLLALAMMLVFSVVAQEYDDLYFTPKDRKQKAKTVEVKDEGSATYQSYTNNTYSDQYSAKEVNPEYIARYQSRSDYQTQSDYAGYTEDNNASYSTPSYSNISYYPEEYAAQEDEGTTIINNYYRTDPRFDRGWDPYWNNGWAFNSGLGYDPWFGWNRGFNMSFGFGWNRVGFGWRNAGFYDPFWDPFCYGYGWGYDPWGWNAGFGWNTGFGWTGGFGWNRWNRFNRAYALGFNAGYLYGGGIRPVVYGEPVDRRNVRVGSRYSRGGRVVGDSRLANSRNNTTPVSGSRANVGSSSGRRDYSETQNEYFRRSRTGLSSRSGTGSSSSNGRAVATTRSNRSNNSSYGRSTSGSLRDGRGTSSGTSRRYRESSATSRSRSYGTSSSGRSSSYGTRSSSRRSSGYSSGSSRSRSSGTSTRSRSSSSSRSSYSRSSSGSSRSSSGRSSGGGSSRSRSRGGGR